jgi:E3 Ubiquitin ligase
LILSILLLRSQEPVRLIVWCGIGFCAGIYLFFYGFRLLQRRHLILDTPSSKIRSAAMGMVEVGGQAVGPYTMVAPMTTRPCYYYRTLVWEWKRQGRSSKWVKVAAECMHLPFFLDDNTGRVLVDPRGAELDLHRDFQEEFCDSFFTIKDPAPDNVHSFLARHGIVTSNKIKVEEFCIKPKNSLFVLGTLAENPGLEVSPEPIHNREATSVTAGDALSFTLRGTSFSFGSSHDRDFDDTALAEPLLAPPSHSSPQVIRLSTGASSTKTSDMTQQQKVAAALMKAGISNPAAWAAAGVAHSAMQVSAAPGVIDASQPGLTLANSRSNGGANGFEEHPPVVLMKGSNNKTFLISWRSQHAVARSLGWKCTLMIWGGPALTLLCLYLLLNLTHLP